MKVIDLKNEDIKPCKVALAQIPVPQKYLNSNFRFKDNYIESQKQVVFKYLNKALEERANFIVFPECSIPRSLFSDIKKFASDNEVFVIGGFEYDENFRNTYNVFTPFKKSWEGTKMNRSPYDHPNMQEGRDLNVFINTGFGDFVPIICYDYTNIEIVQKLAGYVDMIFVIANNPDVNTFDLQAKNDCYRAYCFIIICNSAEYGHSAVYGPINKIGTTYVGKIIKKLEGVGEGLILSEVNVKGLRSFGRNVSGFEFKTPPAGFKRKKLYPYNVKVQETLIKIEELRKNLLVQSTLGYIDGWNLAHSLAYVFNFNPDRLDEQPIVLREYVTEIRELLRDYLKNILYVRRSKEIWSDSGIIRIDRLFDGYLIEEPEAFAITHSLTEIISYFNRMEQELKHGSKKSAIDKSIFRAYDYETRRRKALKLLICVLLRKLGYYLGFPLGSNVPCKGVWVLHNKNKMFLCLLDTIYLLNESFLKFSYWMNNNEELTVVCDYPENIEELGYYTGNFRELLGYYIVNAVKCIRKRLGMSITNVLIIPDNNFLNKDKRWKGQQSSKFVDKMKQWLEDKADCEAEVHLIYEETIQEISISKGLYMEELFDIVARVLQQSKIISEQMEANERFTHR